METFYLVAFALAVIAAVVLVVTAAIRLDGNLFGTLMLISGALAVCGALGAAGGWIPGLNPMAPLVLGIGTEVVFGVLSIVFRDSRY